MCQTSLIFLARKLSEPSQYSSCLPGQRKCPASNIAMCEESFDILVHTFTWVNKLLSSKKEGWRRCFYSQKSLRSKINPSSLQWEINNSDTRAKISLYTMSWERSVAEIHLSPHGLILEYHWR